MKMNEPMGNILFGPLLLRLPLGAYFALAGWNKLYQLAGFVQEVKKFGILPENLSALYGTLLPYVEVTVGIFLILGIWTTLAALLASLILLSIVVAFGLFPGDSHIFNKDMILLGASLSLLFTGSGLYSVDNFRRSGGS